MIAAFALLFGFGVITCATFAVARFARHRLHRRLLRDHDRGGRGRPFEAKMQLGYGCAPDALPLLLTARQCLEIHAGAKRLSSIGADVIELADELRLNKYMDSFVDTLSLGTRQKLAVVLALVGDPKLIVLDEAFNGLDPASAQSLKHHLRSRLAGGRVTLLLATHSLDIVEHHADRAGILTEGRLARIWQSHDLAQLRATGRRFDDALAGSLSAESPMRAP